jgi:hypothetical protein
MAGDVKISKNVLLCDRRYAELLETAVGLVNSAAAPEDPAATLVQRPLGSHVVATIGFTTTSEALPDWDQLRQPITDAMAYLHQRPTSE